MSKGKHFEKLVRLIQESLKDIPNTQIFSNYKIKNISGRKREIDVFIKSFLNNFEIQIAIECKDYKIPIPVEKIDAFNSKCQRIKGISKKIFVSAHGYQADAIEAANNFDIDLYILDEININDIIHWFPFKQLKAKYLLKPPHGILLNVLESELDTIPKHDELMIHYYDNRPPITLTRLLWNVVVFEHQKDLKSILLYDFLKNERNLNYQTIFPYSIKFSGIYIKGMNDKKIDVLRVESAIVGWLEEFPLNIIDARTYKKNDDKSEANVVSVDLDKNEVADIVLTNKNEFKIFHTDSNGQVFELEKLYEYNPKTDEFKSIKENNEG